MTRERLFEAAVTEFSERGYTGASVRQICRRAKANPAAIKYYFGSKDGLYGEVLGTAAAAFADQQELNDMTVAALDREEAVRLLIRQQLMALLRKDKMTRYMRLFAWENVSPSPVLRKFMASEQIPILSVADKIVRRFLPTSSSREEVLVATVWLLNQAAPFIRNRQLLSQSPFNLRVDNAFIDRLAANLANLALGGLVAQAGISAKDLK
jgi:AcrR family transcriptional regulator